MVASSIEKEPLLKDDENKEINKKTEKASSEATDNNANMTAKSSAEVRKRVFPLKKNLIFMKINFSRS